MPEPAFRWALRAAEGGHMGSQYCVACVYARGDVEGVAADPEAAAAWFEKAAEGGHVVGAYTRPLFGSTC